MALCFSCMGMFSLPFDAVGPHHIWTRARDSLDHSCPLCHLIYTRICNPQTLRRPPWWIQSPSSWIDTQANEGIRFSVTSNFPGLLLQFEGFATPFRAQLQTTESLVLELTSAALPRDSAAVLDTSTNSLSAYQCSMRWLQKCTLEHAQCRALQKVKRMGAARPKRLVYVPLVSGKLKPRLCLSANLDHDVHYMTLSHCWGKSPVVSLTKETNDTYMRGIDVTSLKGVFRDAMFVTAKAGVQYIWIDSLCIMQDSTEDWMEESTKMGDIYQHGLCNLAATGFPDGMSGLFVERGSLRIPRMRCTLSQPMYRYGHRFFGLGEISLIDREAWNLEIESGHLNTRAWVVQERLLSPRTLHFGASQISWECCELVACEAYPEGLPSQISVRRAKMDAHFFSLPTPNHGEVEKQLAKLLWNRILEKYARAHLTVPSDRLVAIAGLAKILSPHMGCRYLAGLWEDDIIHQLLWTSGLGLRRFDGGHTDAAPSWSWGSATGIFQPHMTSEDRDDSGYFETVAQVLHADITPLHGDVFTAIKRGYITIRGCLSIAIAVPFGTQVASQDLNLQTTLMEVKWASSNNVSSIMDTWLKLDYVWAGAPLNLRQSNVFFIIPLKGKLQFQATTTYDTQQLFALVIRPVTGRRGVYERVGVMKCLGQNEVQALTWSTGYIPEDYYLAWDGSHGYDITII